MLSAHFVLVFFQHFYREKLIASPSFTVQGQRRVKQRDLRLTARLKIFKCFQVFSCFFISSMDLLLQQ